jgi:hypothetical protein
MLAVGVAMGEVLGVSLKERVQEYRPSAPPKFPVELRHCIQPNAKLR